MKEIPFITEGLDFTYRIKAQRLGFNKYVNVSFEEISGLTVNHISLPSTKTPVSYSIDEYGRLIIPISGEGLACNTYGLELTGFYNNGNWRRQEVPTVEIVKASSQDNYALQESDDRTIDITITLGETTVSSRVFQSAIDAVRKKIADSEGVGDVKINGRSIVETNPITGKKEVNLQKDMLGKVDDVKVNGESVLNAANEANIEVPTTVEQLSDSADFAKKTDLQTMQGEVAQAISDATVSEVEATVDNNTGTPEVDYSFGNGKIQLGFRNLKGEKGDKLQFSDLTQAEKASLKGPQGDSVLVGQGDLPMAHVLGNDNTKAMSQKGVTDALNEAINEHTYVGGEDLELELDTYQESDGWIGTDNKWSPSSYKCRFIPVTAGKTYRIKRNASANSTYAFVVSDDVGDAGDLVSTFAIGVTGVTNLNQMLAEIVAPADARYLYVGSTVNTTNDRLPQSLIVLNRTSISSSIAEISNDLNSYGLPKIIDLTSITEVHIGASGSGKWLSYVWYGKFLYVDGIKKILLKGGTNFTYYLLLKSGSHVLNANVDYATGYSANGNTLEANKTVIVDVPADAKYMFFLTKRGTGSTIACEPAQVTFLGEVVTQKELNKNNFPSFLTIDSEDSGVLYTIDNFIMKHSFEDNVEYLSFSTDLGKSWTTVENTFDEKITHVHYFADGTFMLCTPDKCYWTKDFETFTESTIYDYDGSIYQPVEGETRFYATKGYERTFINGKEWHFFGDYVQTTPNPRLWCTTDYGRTLRCVYAFGLSSINETVYRARHIHAFKYNPFDKKFYVFTGDNANECHVIKGTCAEGVWAWEHVATGDEWKLTQPEFFEGYMVAVTDYTTQALANKKGIIRCPTEDMLADNFTYWFKASSEIMGNAAITKYFRDKNGWRIILPDYAGGAKVLMAKNDLDFVWVNNTDGLRICGFTACNHKGDVYAFYRNVGTSVVGEDWLKIQIPSFNLTKAMRKAGASDFLDYLTTEF